MISEESVDAALNYIRDKSPEHAKAKAQRRYLEEFRKSKKAILFTEFEGKGTIQDKEAFAYSHQEYLDLLGGLKVAIEQEETLKYRIEAAKLKIEVWKAEQFNNRQQDKLHQ